jgi:NAD(P)-dependent dehydrogenase (short-subunit alcohol dehydrogenase family)
MTLSSELGAPRWFVTGASSGLGRALVERALADGDTVIAGVRNALAPSVVCSRTTRTASKSRRLTCGTG